ncbi:hypothetical protein CMQ_4196 [Grosmannia clavigera kw1407]|uniref:Methyltransferase type 11 n=1 Tax=Grosmannia clavigera (strain kw1407 / UAMH 11150) TaxID=655863 RepID=F0XAT4_GROCL|nr:uncharacterized protein CMQ_4196 [Grosmannia clavigera kw1407]EFX06127.1 hypothetical protein CMQ_4196 [Grosmannia clavigera kw1407]
MSKSTSNGPAPPEAISHVASTTIPPTFDEPILAAEVPDGGDGDDLEEDRDSAYDDTFSALTASLSSSVLQYRSFHGRTFHSDKYNAYFVPNDNQQQESLDISDFGDKFPNAQVIGTDISPIQSIWVPPNTKFEMEDATQSWTWPDNEFDFIHMRYLVGAISDWNALFAQAYRCCAPSGWFESCEIHVEHLCDDGTDQKAPVLKQFWRLYEEAVPIIGRSMRVSIDGTQRKAMEAVGFVNIQEKAFKLPVGGWPADKKLSEIGQYNQLTLLNDLEGTFSI